jgi:hypothetical protein
MSVRQFMDAVGSTPFFDLVEITEPKPNSLRLILAEMSVDYGAQDEPPPVPGALPVRHGTQDRTFEVIWERYAVYAVINESYYSGNGGDAFEGNRFRLYSQSRYLRFVEENVERGVPAPRLQTLGRCVREPHRSCDRRRRPTNL